VVEAGADALFVSIILHNKDMLALALRCGYDTLNTIELRKQLLGERPRRGRAEVLGLEWKVI
jgi:hypothetical protein